MRTDNTSGRMQAGPGRFILWTVLAVLLDLLTKQLAVSFLNGRDGLPVIPGIFELLYVENRGAAFGILPDRQILFIPAAVLIILIAGYAFTHSGKKIYRLIAVMMGAGAAGNLIDRLFCGYVRDFLYFSLIDFPVFNVADIYVTVSCVLLILLILTEKERDVHETDH